MGIHGNATCVMHYEGATGYLVGEAHKGMRTMFVMMNEARLGVGLQGLAQAEVAFQNAAEFARDRVQGRSITGVKAPDKPADPIIVHPDVRRMLMDMKAFTEGARAFAYWTALQGDLETGLARCACAREGRRPHVAADAGDQGVPHRSRLQVRDTMRCSCMAARATRANRASSSSCAMRGSR